MRFLLLALLLAGTAAAAVPALARTDRSGHYYLEGVMETGSELLLRPDGRFQWYLVVGALDLFAEGVWSEKDGIVLLTAQKTKDVPRPGFDTLRLTIRDADLIPPDGHGAYVQPRDRDD